MANWVSKRHSLASSFVECDANALVLVIFGEIAGETCDPLEIFISKTKITKIIKHLMKFHLYNFLVSKGL